MKAIEAMFFQCIYIPDALSSKFPFDNNLLRDLAGNAFNLAAFQASLVSWVTALGNMFLCTFNRVPLAVPAILHGGSSDSDSGQQNADGDDDGESTSSLEWDTI